MKKCFRSIAVIGLCMSMVACSNGSYANSTVQNEQTMVQTDAVSQKIIDEIISIGEVTLEDEKKVLDTLELYKTLTDNQKEQVTNYIDLLNAQEKIEQLKELKLQVEKEKKEKYLKIEREYYDYVTVALSKLKADLKKAGTLELHEIIFIYQYNAYWVYIDYSAQNDYGNQVRDYYSYSTFSEMGQPLDSDIFPTYQKICSGGNSNFPYQIGEGFYATDETIEESKMFAFRVDMEDYNR